ncbi:hypothetical protein [Kribbella italica]|uniref:Integral membrane protein n=1 Tax=Kribbella italica TaxID=1540520 RepID=A0A7W9J4Z3_9ACTN|nr:hypothetical protein [Kribbella italica]MBB5834988.1 hypothetical protein [Kribbella italica]
MATDDIRKDLRAAAAARQELGPEYEDAIIDSFLERLDARHAQLRGGFPEPVRQPPPPEHPSRERDPGGLALAIVSLGVAIPITAVSAQLLGFPGLVVSWAGMVAINFARVLGRRR